MKCYVICGVCGTYIDFYHKQNNFPSANVALLLSELQSREERSKQYFDTDLMSADNYMGDEADELYDKVGGLLSSRN